MKILNKIKHFITKWKLVNTDKYVIYPFPYPTEKQQKQVDELYKTVYRFNRL